MINIHASPPEDPQTSPLQDRPLSRLVHTASAVGNLPREALPGCRLPLVLSSAESLSLPCQEIKYLHNMLDQLGFGQALPHIYEDNQAAIAICKTPT